MLNIVAGIVARYWRDGEEMGELRLLLIKSLCNLFLWERLIGNSFRPA
jgi:hypothetical protein